MPRSGTTLVEQILASHPGVHGAGELPHIEQLVTRMPAMASPRVTWPHCLDRIETDQLHRLANEHVDRLSTLGGQARRVVDKMQKNAFHPGLIRMLFPRPESFTVAAIHSTSVCRATRVTLQKGSHSVGI